MHEGEWLSKEAVLRAIEREPEFPGEIPDEMYQTIISGDKELVTTALRIVVQQTKMGIRKSILGG